MTPDDFRTFYPHLIGWIHQTLGAYAKEANTIASLGFPRLPRYFSPELLASTNVVAVERLPIPPLSSMGLSGFAEFDHGDYAGITYLNTFFVKRRSAAIERLHFHELIHVIQWRLLGPEAFLATYADGLETFGYRNSPLESMAYDAEASFCQSDQPFDAANLVAEQLSRMQGIEQ